MKTPLYTHDRMNEIGQKYFSSSVKKKKKSFDFMDSPKRVLGTPKVFQDQALETSGLNYSLG